MHLVPLCLCLRRAAGEYLVQIPAPPSRKRSQCSAPGPRLELQPDPRAGHRHRIRCGQVAPTKTPQNAGSTLKSSRRRDELRQHRSGTVSRDDRVCAELERDTRGQDIAGGRRGGYLQVSIEPTSVTSAFLRRDHRHSWGHGTVGPLTGDTSAGNSQRLVPPQISGIAESN